MKTRKTNAEVEAALRACNAAVKAIAGLRSYRWAGFVLFILEALANEPVSDSTYRAVLEEVREAIDERLNGGSW